MPTAPLLSTMMCSKTAMTCPAKLSQRTMPAAGMSFKSGLGMLGRYAMNMRAAEAIVSKVPKAMNTLPISEVSSQSE